MRGTGRILATYEVHTARGFLIGHVERAYHPANAWPGVVGYTPGRNMYRFLADQIDNPNLFWRHGRYFERLREARTELAEDGLIVGPKT